MADLNLEDILVDKSSGHDILEVPLTERVFKTLFIISAAAGFLVIVQMVNIGIVNKHIYTASAFDNAVNIKMEPAPRGIIKDRFSNNLVVNEPAFKTYLNPLNLPQDVEEKELILEELGAIFGIKVEDLKEKLAGAENSRILLDGNTDHETLVTLSSRDFPGVEVGSGFVRVHARPYVFSHIVGYTGLVNKDDLQDNPQFSFEDEIGKSGLEFFYDEKLRGQNGKTIFLLDAQGNVKNKRVLSKPKAGEDLETFIDKDLQEVFYDRLLAQIRNLGVKSGAGIAINPKTGELLSLISIPSFDNKNLGPSLKDPNQPFFNRAISGLYNPGSTIKPLHALAALEENIVSPEKSFFSSGLLKIENPFNPDQPSIFRDWKPHGWVNLRSAIARSSNVYFYIVGGGLPAGSGYEKWEGLGASRLKKWWQMFRLGNMTEIDLPGEKSGFLPSPDWKKQALGEEWRLGDTYNVSIGQGDLLLTPIGLLNYISAIANGGYIYKIRVAKDEKPVILADLTEDLRGAIGEVQKGMIDAVRKPYGTANILSDLPMSVAAKTGSAEVGTRSTNAFFVGYAPADDPEIAILVMIEDAKEGSLNAVPVARDVFLWYYNNRLN